MGSMFMKSTKLAISLFLVAAVAAGIVVFERNKKSTDERLEAVLSSVAPWDVSRYRAARAAWLPEVRTDGYSKVPLTSFGGREGDSLGDLYVNEHYASKFISSGLEIAFPFPGVPVDLKVIDGQYNFAFRKVFDGQLFRLTYNRSGQLLKTQAIEFDGIDYPIFRASTVGKGRLYWVVCDNKKRKNYLMGVDHVQGDEVGSASCRERG